jgi:thioredoxin 1
VEGFESAFSRKNVSKFGDRSCPQEVLEELGEKIELLKLSVDKHPQLFQQFAVRSIPHYILFKRGKILWRKGGIITKRDLLHALKDF